MDPPFSTDAPASIPGRFHGSGLRPASGDRGRAPASCSPARGPELVGCSTEILQLKRMIDVVAPTPSTVLINGETGTGKEVVARRLHARSDRAHRPFVAVNCAALPENLVESELFGFERGAFTGAAYSKPGYFEEASGGTLFLDEVTELPPGLQAKLLRALQEREIRRLGGTRSIAVDVRVVAASNVDLAEALRDGRLRSDLYYRLRVIELHLPPLRGHREDIPLLCEHFLKSHASVCSPLRRTGTAALEAMEAYHWPGNVRELENVVERAMVFARAEETDTLLPHHLPAEICGHFAASPDERSAGEARLDMLSAIRRLRRRYLAEALHLASGNKVEAARLLGISRRGLYDLIEEAGGEAPPPG